MKEMMLLINPVAGRGGFKDGLGDVLEIFNNSGYLPTVYMTTGPGDAVEKVREKACRYDIIVCMGGDGTLSEVVSGIMCCADPPPLGYIPMGTANDVASTLSLPKNPAKAAKRIVDGSPMPFDVGAFGSDGYFAYIAAFGAFTEVSYETNQEIKHSLGHMAYVLEGMRQLPRISYYKTTVEYDDGLIEDDIVFGAVANSTSIAGIKLDSNVVELGDGLFEVILIKNPRNLGELNGIIGDILSRNYQSQNVSVLHSKSVRFAFDFPVAWTRDGENGGLHREILLENHHKAIRFQV